MRGVGATKIMCCSIGTSSCTASKRFCAAHAKIAMPFADGRARSCSHVRMRSTSRWNVSRSGDRSAHARACGELLADEDAVLLAAVLIGAAVEIEADDGLRSRDE